MAVRAYRITHLKYEDIPTFNLWNDDELLAYLEPFIPETFDYNGGYLEFSQENLEEALKEAEEEKVSKDTCDTLKQMIAEAKKSEFGWVAYWCV